MNLGKRILLLCVGLIALAIIEGTWASLTMRSMSGRLETVSANSLPAIYSLARADSLGKDLRGKMRSHCVSTDLKEMDKIETEVGALSRNFEREMNVYKAFMRSPDEEALRSSVLKAYKLFEERWFVVRTESASGNKKQAMEQFLAGVMDGFKDLQKSIDSLNTFKRAEADREVASVKRIAALGKTAMLFLALLVIVSGGVAAFMVLHWVKSRLSGSIAELDSAAAGVSSAASEGSRTSCQQMEAATAQAAAIEETAAAAAEASSAAERNSRACQGLFDCLSSVDHDMELGAKAVRDLSETVSAVAKSSQKVSKILAVINEVAFQTNILSLNASVEAARAGEAGLGFSIVADEVRSLARRCADAAQQTGVLIRESVASVGVGETRVEDARRMLSAVGEGTIRLRALGETVNQETADQAHVISHISAALTELGKLTEQNASDAQTGARQSEEGEKRAESLREVVSKLQAIAG